MALFWVNRVRSCAKAHTIDDRKRVVYCINKQAIEKISGHRFYGEARYLNGLLYCLIAPKMNKKTHPCQFINGFMY